METSIDRLLENREGNHILPFLWVHGETHDVYKKMIKVIYDANIRAFCVESRPHKEFGKQQWWEDLEVILTEAEKYKMQVWILDDKHFPTGYANGGVEKAPPELRRWHLCHRQTRARGGKRIRLNIDALIHPHERYSAVAWIVWLVYANNMRLPRKCHDDSLLSCTAWGKNGRLDLTPYIKKGRLVWDAPEGDWTIDVCGLSRNTGFHRSYINMLDEVSCRIQIDEVYEPHYEHFKRRFGNTIAGFFSDEPELGNGNYLNHYNTLGTDQSLPYSRELADALREKLGPEWKALLPLLWASHGDAFETARVRYIYMDCVTRLVEKDFSMQIGTWCDERGVEYIGHVIEDNNQHARTSTSLGHYFRGLKWQTMAGIDDIGGQVYPGGEDKKSRNVFGYINDGEFYHYALGKLGVSLGSLNPRMRGRTMCEIFGNYGWSEGVRLEKYLVDHFMVRGVNYFVPHAFTCKTYPDRDCPPHFYAHGHNPQYRHFGALMRYTNRVCNLISGGRIDAPIAVLYHAEAEWSGKCMLMQKPARILWDNQIDFNFVPADVFAEREFYHTEISRELIVNGRPHRALLIPYSQFITAETAQGITELMEKGCKVAFIDALPEGVCTGESLPAAVGECGVVKLEALADYADAIGLRTIRLAPASDRLRCMRYLGKPELFYLFNEGGGLYDGVISLPVNGGLYGYDAWNDRAFALDYQEDGKTSRVRVSLEAGKSLLIIRGEGNAPQLSTPLCLAGDKTELKTFTQSVCKSIDYPHFTGSRQIQKLETYSNTDKKFSGYIRYETIFSVSPIEKGSRQTITLEITDAYEGVEAFVNGVSAGIQITPRFIFDLTELCKQDENHLAIEVAATLERERGGVKRAAPTGITGEVNLYIKCGSK
ncbi:MAG: hypothetical protein LBT00_10255 [Spirochaetaceae bacterium]|jgi:hypothetical protein|nr:hypothetical protein [Spirochaetaceae bacterium]